VMSTGPSTLASGAPPMSTLIIGVGLAAAHFELAPERCAAAARAGTKHFVYRSVAQPRATACPWNAARASSAGHTSPALSAAFSWPNWAPAYWRWKNSLIPLSLI
jgi:hypothetical protein